MKSVYDVRMLLKRFGTFVYSRDRIGDLILMEAELEELHRFGMITDDEYMNGKIILQKEKNELETEERRRENE